MAIEGGADAALLFGFRCEPLRGDTQMCPSSGALAGVHIAPRYRILPHWSLGARGAVSWGSSITFWQAELDARFHLLGASRPDPWVGIDAGVVAASEQIDATPLARATSMTRTAPMFGMGAGLTFSLGAAFRIGPELRFVAMPFGSSSGATTEPRMVLANQFGVSLSLTAAVLLGS